jgi:hypothetical protein
MDPFKNVNSIVNQVREINPLYETKLLRFRQSREFDNDLIGSANADITPNRWAR